MRQACLSHNENTRQSVILSTVHPRAARQSARQRIVDTAARLFYKHGYHSVGVDTIIRESGVAKMSLYRHFQSKDALISACLEQMNQEFWRWMDAELRSVAEPREKLLTMFRAVEKLSTSAKCLGCCFQATASEFPELDHVSHTTARSHKEQVLRRLEELAAQDHLQNPKRLAGQLLLLMEGAWAAARMFGSKSPAVHVAKAAKTLIEASSPTKPGARKS